MTLKQYLAEEVALDHADGLITRREAIRRLGLMGISAAAALSVLAACAQEETDEAGGSPAATAAATPKASPGAASAQAVTWRGPEDRTLQGAWAEARSSKGAVLVVHENRGLNDHTRSVAARLAGDGYSALAIDLLSAEGGTEKVGDQAAAMGALSNAPPERLIADLHSGVDEIERRAKGKKLAAIGFCFGGGMVWRLLNDGEPRLAAAVPFYGPAPENPDFSKSKGVAVLSVYAELDARVNAGREATKEALEKAGLTNEVVTFPGADHAFFNDTGPRYNAEAATKAYAQMLDWFGRYLN